jgi:hypothetical protein
VASLGGLQQTGARADIRSVQLDGRITFWANGTFQGLSMLDCLKRAGEDGPALPGAMFATRPGGQ